MYVANGRGGVVDEFRFDEVVQRGRTDRRAAAVAPPPRRGRRARPPAAAPSVAAGSAPPDPDVLEQLRKLGELRDAGVLTDAEFATKKAELLGRI